MSYVKLELETAYVFSFPVTNKFPMVRFLKEKCCSERQPSNAEDPEVAGNNNIAGGKDSKNKRIETPILIAAKNGVTEMVEKNLELFPVAIDDMNDEKKNIVLSAVENTQLGILEAVNKSNHWKYLIQSIDIDGNNIFHLVAKYELQIQGYSALQMQDEIKWYDVNDQIYVKSFLPSHFIFLENKKGETPEEVFLRHHKDLVEKSDEWLSRTSEYCSVVATLVAGVSFATSSNIPGGNDDKTGKPTLEGHDGFDIFAITALIALCFSVTALIMFLSILISRKQPADFMKRLPVKLFLALSSLFVSIFSMFFSFCAAHSFVLEDKFKKSVLLLYIIICLPVYFTIVEFPLYMDLFKGIFMKVPQPYNQRRI
ncbi:uncharacterized protein LOC114717478 [Neltuma alba]|uniref:uncharacterized protein LOC114717478 n=1 Tax=Neltuma alba TaxID=207710 RepID=UPI0010A3CC32|nr:uncharacterized protein LOC114717478 [Prosopis alba]